MFKERSKGKDLGREMAEIYGAATKKQVETMTEADFRAWGAGQVREMLLADTKPRLLKTIVNPVRLVEALR